MLCGGVGGARAALALYENFPQDSLTFLVNTGDDFTHLGLEIWPDWDTVIYHLTGLEDSSRGWGRADEGLRAMEEFRRFGAPDWFHLGDRDLALHVYRSWAIRQGWSRAKLADALADRLKLSCRVLPLTERGMETRLRLRDGREMEFQDWFVKQQGGPEVQAVLNQRPEQKAITDGVKEALKSADFMVMAPSNPYLSLGPMLGHPELGTVIRNLTIPKLAVSPLVGGKAIKGPLDRLIASLSSFQGQTAIAHFWSSWVDGLLLPAGEIDAVENPPLRLFAGPTMLNSSESRRAFCDGLKRAWESF
jgi:LPPG:FO 2-phospho-L-lactate transferase